MNQLKAKPSLLIQQAETQAEVIDTVADVGLLVFNFENSLSDGFQPFADFLQLAAQEPAIREIINDFPDFLAQLRNLESDTLTAARDEVVTRFLQIGQPVGKIANGYMCVIGMLGDGADAVFQVLTGVQNVRNTFDLLADGRNPYGVPVKQ